MTTDLRHPDDDPGEPPASAPRESGKDPRPADRGPLPELTFGGR